MYLLFSVSVLVGVRSHYFYIRAMSSTQRCVDKGDALAYCYYTRKLTLRPF